MYHRCISIIDPAIALSMLILPFIGVIERGLFEWKRICTSFLYRLFIIVLLLEIHYQEGMIATTIVDCRGLFCVQSSLIDPLQKANALNNQFHSVFTPVLNISRTDFNKQCNTPPGTQHPKISHLTIKTEGIQKLLCNLNPSKAEGRAKSNQNY